MFTFNMGWQAIHSLWIYCEKEHVNSGFIEKIFWYPKLIIWFLERILQIRDNIFWRRIPIWDPIARMTMHLPDKHERPEQTWGKMINAVFCLHWGGCTLYIGVIFKCRIAQIVLVFICCFDCNWCSWIKCKKSTMNQEFPLSTRSRCLERVAPLERRRRLCHRSPQSCARRNVIGL